MIETYQQKVPVKFAKREALRDKGQFWTPGWLARVMSRWVTADNPIALFDPAVGPGTFFAAARSIGYSGALQGFELHPAAFDEGRQFGLQQHDFSGVTSGDFLASNEVGQQTAIISNPPYIRHHRISLTQKTQLKQLAWQLTGLNIDGRAGLHVYFLIKCLHCLAPGGQLAFLLPADTFEGKFSSSLWAYIGARFRLDAVLLFDKAAAPFPQLDVNSVVVLITNAAPVQSTSWFRVSQPDEAAVLGALGIGLPPYSTDLSSGTKRELAELLTTGLTRSPAAAGQAEGIKLGALAKLVRGIASGANEFFLLTQAQLDAQDLPRECFARAIARTRDCNSDTLTAERLEELDRAGTATYLLNLPGRQGQTLTAALAAYLAAGEALGLPERALLKTRRPWFKMESREIPPLLFSYLGRGHNRFILNRAGALPLTCFLCVYPHNRDPRAVELLWRALNHPATIQNLPAVGKSYGQGSIKVEPRQLDNLLIPFKVLAEVGLEYRDTQLQGLFGGH